MKKQRLEYKVTKQEFITLVQSADRVFPSVDVEADFDSKSEFVRLVMMVESELTKQESELAILQEMGVFGKTFLVAEKDGAVTSKNGGGC